MKLDSLVRRRRYCRLKSCGPHENGVSKRTPYRLRLRVDAMAHGSALHEYNRMMPILPRDRCRQSRDESRLRATDRSEEHTSELQSQSNLVCRLLLEKKKKKKCQTLCMSQIMVHT